MAKHLVALCALTVTACAVTPAPKIPTLPVETTTTMPDLPSTTTTTTPDLPSTTLALPAPSAPETTAPPPVLVPLPATAVRRSWPVPVPVPRMKAPPVSPVPVAGVWDRLAACESGGNWSINTGNGYSGGVQMNSTFWRSYGGLAFAARPDLASRAQQIVVAQRGQAAQGWGAWPACSRKLGLR